MKFIPNYRVCYNGEFYECDEEIDIDPADADEMSEHGEIVDESAPPDDTEIQEEPESEETTEEKPKRGRRRKNDESGEDEAQDE